jgi:hypothetical protein
VLRNASQRGLFAGSCSTYRYDEARSTQANSSNIHHQLTLFVEHDQAAHKKKD